MLNKFIGVIIVVVFFFAGKYAVQYGFNEYNESTAVKKIDELFIELEKEADTYGDETPRSVALVEAAKKKIAEDLTGTVLEKKKLAVSNFMGFYLVNHRTRKIFCKNVGVDISSFTNEFMRLHKSEIEISKKLVFKKPDNIEQVYELLNPQLEKVIKQDMSDISTQYSLTTVEACKLFSDESGLAVAKNMRLSERLPVVYQAIHASE